MNDSQPAALSQTLLDMVVDRSPIPMWVGSPDGTTLRANQALYNTLNLTPEQIIGKYNLLQDDNLAEPEIAAKIDTLFSRKEPIQFETDWKSGELKEVDFSGGHDLFIDASMYPLLNPEGEITHIICQWVDLTVRKKFENELSASEELFRTICEKAPVLIGGFDENGRCAIWNEQCRKTFGWTIDEINAQDEALALFYPDPAIREKVMHANLTDPDGQFREWYPRTKDGRILTTIWANFRLPGGKTYSVGHDITELKNTEKKLRGITENSTNMFYSHTPDGVLNYVSPQVKNILGCTPEEALTKWTEFITDHPVNELAMNLTEKAIETGEAQPTYELQLRHRDGHTVWVEVREAPVVEQGKTVSMVGALVDITERKLAEEERQKNEKALKNHAIELEQFNKMAVGRELRMIELKKEINALCHELGKEAPYA